MSTESLLELQSVWKRVSAETRFAKLYNYQQRQFRLRLEIGWPDIVRSLRTLYGDREDFAEWVTRCVSLAANAYAARPDDLRTLDERRTLEPDWYRRSDRVGYIAYVDRFADTLNGVVERIPYLQEIGINFLHLMPLLKPRVGANDGGYAVADYRAIDPALGDMDDFERLTRRLRENDMSLMIDFVCNHTADDHDWVQRARAGDEAYQAYYFMFPDRTLPDQYDATLREVFPEFKRGNFIFDDASQRWVWSTFNPYQWDLNYGNPAVFAAMLDNMLFLANKGVEILRMDAVAFMWKQMGTNCENLPQTHAILQAFRALTLLTAPGLLLLAEAIVSPEDVVPYFGLGEATNKECEMAYHNSLMVLLWSALAERSAKLATVSLQNIPHLPRRATWLTYVRCHDDIGWAITDYNAAAVGLQGFWHRAFLSDFYAGIFENSFARGAVFQFNPDNQDRRISGACASLAGLEVAVEKQDWAEVELAIGRILFLHSLTLAYGGLPLIYMGDELGLLNDYSFTDDEAHRVDNRWLHRPKMDWSFAAARHQPHTIPGLIFRRLRHLISVRQRLTALHADAATIPVWVGNDQVLAIVRESPRGRLLVMGNCTETTQHVTARRLGELGFGGILRDHIGDRLLHSQYDIALAPYETLWLETVD